MYVAGSTGPSSCDLTDPGSRSVPIGFPATLGASHIGRCFTVRQLLTERSHKLRLETLAALRGIEPRSSRRQRVIISHYTIAPNSLARSACIVLACLSASPLCLAALCKYTYSFRVTTS